MSVPGRGHVALVFRGANAASTPGPRLDLIVDALREMGLSVDAVPWVDGMTEDVAARLSAVGGVLVWVDPLSDDGDRRELDQVMREVARNGVWVSTHPDVLDRLGTKEVLVATRELSWGCDVHLYRSPEEFYRAFPERLAAEGARVLKASRGNGGRTVWKVCLPEGQRSSEVQPETGVVVQHARIRDGSSTLMPLSSLMAECAVSFAAWEGTGGLVDQEFIPGITHGLVRCYLVGATVVGFARQYPEGARPRGPWHVDATAGPSADAVMGLPSAKTMYPPDEPAFAELRHRLETEWVPGMRRLLGLAPDDLPALWDVDLLIGGHDGEPFGQSAERFVLCEINASCVTPFPPAAPPRIAVHVRQVMDRRANPER